MRIQTEFDIYDRNQRLQFIDGIGINIIGKTLAESFTTNIYEQVEKRCTR